MLLPISAGDIIAHTESRGDTIDYFIGNCHFLYAIPTTIAMASSMLRTR